MHKIYLKRVLVKTILVSSHVLVVHSSRSNLLFGSNIAIILSKKRLKWLLDFSFLFHSYFHTPTRHKLRVYNKTLLCI